MIKPSSAIRFAESGSHLANTDDNFYPMLKRLSRHAGSLFEFDEGLINLKTPTHFAFDMQRQDSEVAVFDKPEGLVLKRYRRPRDAALQFLTMNALARRLPQEPYTADNRRVHVTAARHHALVTTPNGVIAVMEQAAGRPLHEIATAALYGQNPPSSEQDKHFYVRTIPRLARFAANEALGERLGPLLVDDIAKPYQHTGRVMMQNIFVYPVSPKETLLTIIDQPRLNNPFDAMRANIGALLLRGQE